MFTSTKSLTFSKRFVRVDAHIAPAKKSGFTEIFGEFDGAQRVDVGIDPYTDLKTWTHNQIEAAFLTEMQPFFVQIPTHRALTLAAESAKVQPN